MNPNNTFTLNLTTNAPELVEKLERAKVLIDETANFHLEVVTSPSELNAEPVKLNDNSQSKVIQFYNSIRWQDDNGRHIVHPHQVEGIVEVAEYEGVLLGLKICKEMFAQDQITHESIRENEIYYGELIANKMADLVKE